MSNLFEITKSKTETGKPYFIVRDKGGLLAGSTDVETILRVLKNRLLDKE